MTLWDYFIIFAQVGGAGIGLGVIVGLVILFSEVIKDMFKGKKHKK